MTSDVIEVSRFPVESTSQAELATRLLEGVAIGKKQILFFVNTNFVVNCRFVLDWKNRDSVIMVNDGIGMDIAAKLFKKRRFAANLNGTDFTPFLCQQAKSPLKIFMLGAQPDVLKRAVTYVQNVLKQEVVGSCDGYQDLKNSTNIAQRINDSGAQILLVAMGNPLQEKWILDHYDALNANVMMGVGALFDFWSGDKPRAPKWIQAIRLEWFYRLCLEPRRLLRRYTFDIGVFLWHCYKYR